MLRELHEICVNIGYFLRKILPLRTFGSAEDPMEMEYLNRYQIYLHSLYESHFDSLREFILFGLYILMAMDISFVSYFLCDEIHYIVQPM